MMDARLPGKRAGSTRTSIVAFMGSCRYDLASQLDKRADICTEVHKIRDGATTHGGLTVPALLAMLAEDAGLIITRPGSWEGANMTALLKSHGYQF